MNESNLVTYIGPAGLHDGTINSIDHRNNDVAVSVHGPEGQRFTISFTEVSSIDSKDAVGMLLYALSELEISSQRRFVFVNWDEDSTAHLEIIASGYNVTQREV